MQRDSKKAIWGWAMYDWANSAFATTIIAGFFPVFFKQYWSAGADVNVSTARLGDANSLAGIIVALLAPVIGAKEISAFFCLYGHGHDLVPVSCFNGKLDVGDKLICVCQCGV
jgi:hypothetical protein